MQKASFLIHIANDPNAVATATLTYDLADPDDEREHRYALGGKDAIIALERIDMWAREHVRYGEISDETRGLLEHLRQHLIPHDLTELLV